MGEGRSSLASVFPPHAVGFNPVCSLTSDLWPQSMFAVGWMELKEPRRAQDLLERSFANITEPFKVNSQADPTCLPPGPLGGRSGSPALGRGSHRRVRTLLEQGQQPRGAHVLGVSALTAFHGQVWTENADGSGAVNFLTGMGGFLQAALFGFAGFR